MEKSIPSTSNLIEMLSTVPIDDEQAARLRELSPRLHLTVHPGRKPEDVPAELWSRAEILYTDRVLPTPEMSTALRWVQFHYTGIDFALDLPLLERPGLVVTTLSGAAAPQMAEHAISMMLALGHHFPDLTQIQSRAEWPRERWERFLPLELRESTVGIVGYGSIGREIARLARGFGARILAVKRDAMHPADTDYTIEGLGDPEGSLFDRLYPGEAIRSMLKTCDYVVICLPLTPQTRGFFGAAQIAAMKPSAYLIHLGRGGIVDNAALATALQEKRIAGAALDVFNEEPLPNNSILWRMNNVILSPHIAGVSAHYEQRAFELLFQNVQRYLSGSPLLNRFDRARGY